MASDATTTEIEAASEFAEAPGMPQLDFSNWVNQIFWLLVAIVLIYFILSKVALPRIAAVLSERSMAISGDLDRADALKQQAVEAEEAYTKALADARAEAGQIVADAKAEIQKDLNLAIEKADAEIAAKAAESEAAISEIRAGALKAVEAVAKATTGEIIGAVMPGAGDAKAITAAVKAQMKEV